MRERSNCSHILELPPRCRPAWDLALDRAASDCGLAATGRDRRRSEGAVRTLRVNIEQAVVVAARALADSVLAGDPGAAIATMFWSERRWTCGGLA